MKCFHCGAELKQLFSSSYCPNDCDKKAVSTETAAASVTSGFKCGDKVRIVKYVNDKYGNHAIYYSIGDEYYFLEYYKDPDIFPCNYNATVSSSLSGAKSGLMLWYVHSDELELVK